MLSSKPNRSVGLDIGTYSVKAVQMSKSGGHLRVDHAGYAAIDTAQLSVDPVQAQAAALTEALQNIPTKNTVVVGSLPGQTVVIRYPRLPDMPDNELRQAIDREAAQNLPFELSEVFIDSVVLDRCVENDEHVAKVLLVAAKHELIDSCIRVAEAAGLQYAILTVDALALADAAECCGFLGKNETVALLDIGAASTIVHFLKDGVSNYYRDVNWGARELVQAIARANRCEPPMAEQILRDIAKRSTPGEAPPPQRGKSGPSASPDPFEEETPPEPSFELDIGDSPLEPLEEEQSGRGERAPTSGAGTGQGQPIEQVLRLPLTNLVNEVRRSFDFYEHQMYERSVERVLISGGVGCLPLIRDRLKQELGLEQIDVVNPASSQLTLGRAEDVAPLLKQPAQFMVAVGLAARGAVEL